LSFSVIRSKVFVKVRTKWSRKKQQRRKKSGKKLVLDAITYNTFPKREEDMKSGVRPAVRSNRKGATAIKERGIVTRVAHVEVEVETAVVTVVVSGGLISSVRGGSAGSTLLRGGELVFGRLAVDSVGELVDCDSARGGVEVEPVE
jgi:hypothetical protein